MKIIDDCWDEIGASDCSFGVHIFEKSTAQIYLHHGLDVGAEIGRMFQYASVDGFAGPCILVFRGVKRFGFRVREYEVKDRNIEWKEPIIYSYHGSAEGGAKTYNLGGGLYGLSAYVAIEIEAQKFELHILETDEPFIPTSTASARATPTKIRSATRQA